VTALYGREEFAAVLGETSIERLSPSEKGKKGLKRSEYAAFASRSKEEKRLSGIGGVFLGGGPSRGGEERRGGKGPGWRTYFARGKTDGKGCARDSGPPPKKNHLSSERSSIRKVRKKNSDRNGCEGGDLPQSTERFFLPP